MLVPWNAFDSMRLFDRRLDPFGPSYDGKFPVFRKTADATALNAGLEETDDAFIFTADLPGMKREDVAVTFEDSVLTVTGERTFEAPEGFTPTRRERRFDRFEKRFRFQTPLVPGEATADFSDGVLTVVLPKSEQAKPMSITIN